MQLSLTAVCVRVRANSIYIRSRRDNPGGRGRTYTFRGNFSCLTIWHRLHQIESHAGSSSARESRARASKKERRKKTTKEERKGEKVGTRKPRKRERRERREVVDGESRRAIIHLLLSQTNGRGGKRERKRRPIYIHEKLVDQYCATRIAFHRVSYCVWIAEERHDEDQTRRNNTSVALPRYS